MQRGRDLVGLRIAQFRGCCPQRLPGGILIACADAGMAEQKSRQVFRQFHRC